MITNNAERTGERGAGMAEYTFLLTLIALALIAGFQQVATAIGAAVGNAAGVF